MNESATRPSFAIISRAHVCTRVLFRFEPTAGVFSERYMCVRRTRARLANENRQQSVRTCARPTRVLPKELATRHAFEV